MPITTRSSDAVLPYNADTMIWFWWLAIAYGASIPVLVLLWMKYCRRD
jgi:hypothetical protein